MLIEVPTEVDASAERVVAACVMIGPDEVDEARAIVRPADFADYSCAAVFEAACHLRDAGRPVDAGTVLLRLKETGQAADLGDRPHDYLAGLVTAVRSSAGLDYAARRVREGAARRALVRLGAELVRDAAAPGEPADELAARYERRLRDAVGDRVGADGPVKLSAAVADALNRYDDAAAGRRTRVALPTGLPALDQLTGGGFTPGQLVVAAGRPGLGKSALALRFAEAAARAGHGVLLVSLEMSEEENTDRLVAAAARVQLPRLRGAARMDDAQAARVAAQVLPGGLAELPVWVDDRPGQSAAGIAATTRLFARKHGVKLVVVDYLQLAHAEDPKAPRYLQVGTLAKRLKELARRAGVAVVALAQLNRECEAREGGRPRLSDLRDSGEVEQDADVVLLLHRLDDDELKAVHPVDLIVAKQRNGPTGTVHLDYHRPYTRFEPRAPAP